VKLKGKLFQKIFVKSIKHYVFYNWQRKVYLLASCLTINENRHIFFSRNLANLNNP